MSRVNLHAAVAAALVAGMLLYETACHQNPAAEASAAPAVKLAATSEQPLPAPGTALISFANGRVSVRSNGAERMVILERLAQKADFELVSGTLKRQSLTLRIEDAQLSEALATVLVGLRYGLELDFDAAEALHVIRRVSVGRAITGATARIAAAPTSESGWKEDEFFKRPRRRPAAMSPAKRQRINDRSAARAGDMDPDVLVQLEDPDPEVRAEAVFQLPEFGNGADDEEHFQRVTTILADDPDSSVRIAAVERIGEFESAEAVTPLAQALSDSDRGVVLAAIEALESIDDPSAIPHLESLLDDFDGEIRNAADSAIQNIE
jgi:hypothetical protein